MNEKIARRSHKRYKVKDGTFAVLYENSSKLAPIIDISAAGFSFRYSDSQFIDNDRDGKAFFYQNCKSQLEHFSTFDIFLVDSGIYLDRLPCKIVSNFELDEMESTNSIPMRRCCVQFEELASEQISDLESFIKNCTEDSK